MGKGVTFTVTRGGMPSQNLPGDVVSANIRVDLEMEPDYLLLRVIDENGVEIEANKIDLKGQKAPFDGLMDYVVPTWVTENALWLIQGQFFAKGYKGMMSQGSIRFNVSPTPAGEKPFEGVARQRLYIYKDY